MYKCLCLSTNETWKITVFSWVRHQNYYQVLGFLDYFVLVIFSPESNILIHFKIVTNVSIMGTSPIAQTFQGIKAILFCFLPCCGWLDDSEGWEKRLLSCNGNQVSGVVAKLWLSNMQILLWCQIMDTPFTTGYFSLINWPLKLAKARSPFVCLWQGSQAVLHYCPLGTKNPVWVRWMNRSNDHLALSIGPISPP